MAEEREVIILDVDEIPVIQKTARANTAIEGYEKRTEKANQNAARSFESTGETIIRTTDRSRNAIERMVAAAEKKASFAGLDRTGRLVAEREQLLSRIGGDTQAVDRVRAAYDKLIASEEKVISLGDRLKEAIGNPLQAASSGWESFTGRLGAAGVAMGVAAAAVGVLGKGLFDLTAAQGRAAEQTLNFADRLGVTVNQAQDLQNAADLAGVGIGGLDAGVRLLSAALEDQGGAGAKSAKALQSLGISTLDLATANRRELGPVFVEVLEKLSRIESQSERVRKANELLGRGGVTLQPLIKNLDTLRETVEKLRVDPRMLEDLAKADDVIGVMAVKWNRFKTVLAANVGIPVLNQINAAIEAYERFASRNDQRQQESQQFQEDFGLSTRSLKAPSIGSQGIAAEEKRIANERARGVQLQEQFARREVASVDSIEAKLKSLKATRDELEGTLAGKQGAVLATTFNQKRAELDRITGEISALEARKKSIDSAPAEAKKAEEAAQRVSEFMRKFNADINKFQAKSITDRLSQLTETLQTEISQSEQAERVKAETRAAIFAESESAMRAAYRQREDLELQGLSRSRDAQLRALEAVPAKTVEQKIALENQKAAIETEYLQKSFAMESDMLQRRSQLAIEGKLLEARIAGATDQQVASIRYNLEAKLQQDLAELRGANEEKLAVVRDDASIRSAQIMADANQKAFDRTRDGFESLLDQMFSRTKSWGDVIKGILTASLLTPVKQMASTWFASMITGQPVAGAGGMRTAGGGLAGMLGGFGGLLGGGGTGSFGGSPIIAQPTFPGGSGFGGLASGAGLLGGLKAQGAGLMGGLRSLGSLGRIKNGMGGEFTQGANHGVGGATGGAMLAGGGILAMDGLRRGGFLGLAETTAGGALIGAKFGGPIGAAIGAGIGAIAGTVRLFLKGAEDKMVAKIRGLYGLSISKSLAGQIVAVTKQSFGGDTDLAIRSPQVRDLLELYAMSTGQKFSGSPTPRAVQLSQSGGNIYQMPSYSNGSALPSLGGTIPTISLPQSAGPSTTVLQLDAEATRQVLQGQAATVITEQPQLVAAASAKNTQSSRNRRETAAAYFGSPGLITS